MPTMPDRRLLKAQRTCRRGTATPSTQNDFPPARTRRTIHTETREPDAELQAFKRVIDDFNAGRTLNNDAIRSLEELVPDRSRGNPGTMPLNASATNHQIRS